MKNFEITKEGIVIIQWLKLGDPQLGEVLYSQLKHKEIERDNYFVEYYKVDNRDEFVAVLQKLIDETKEGTIFTLHIVSHGYEGGIGLEVGTNEVRWGELFHYTRQLNELMGNNLLLVLSSCVGGGILSHIEPEQRAPYRAIIANTRAVMMTAYKALGFDIANYPNAYHLFENEITLPLHTKLTDEDVEYVITNFVDIIKNL